MDNKTRQWAEKKIGRPITGTNGTVYLTRAELMKLTAGPSPWRLMLWIAAGLIAAQVITYVLQ